MINIAICDDNEPIVNMVYTILSRYNFDGAEVMMHKYYDCIPLAKAVDEGMKYDILFLDVIFERSNGGMEFNGIQAMERINIMDPLAIIICMSQYNYYKELSKVETLYFLEKPFQEYEIINVLEKALIKMRAMNNKCYFIFKVRSVYMRVDLRKVKYIYSTHRKVNVYLAKEEFSFYGKLEDVSQKINRIYPKFFRANKSFFVNRDYVEVFTKKSILIDGKEISVSRKRRKDFYNLYGF